MIVVCEAQCKDISHESVNSAFIYGLRLAYPNDKIVLFCDTTHFRSLENVWKLENIFLDNLEHISINFNASKSFSLGGILRYYSLFKKILDKTLLLNSDKVFLLSINPVILSVIKVLKQKNKYRKMCFTSVLHGEMEDIANIEYQEPYQPVFSMPSLKTDKSKLGFKEILFKVIRNRKKVFVMVFHKIFYPYQYFYSKYSLFFKRKLRVKKVMQWQHSNDLKYIALSPHIIENSKRCMDTDWLNFRLIIMPKIFSIPHPQADNQFIRFAVFGYGDSSQMYKLLTILQSKNISLVYEIKIISMDTRGTQGFSNIIYISQGNPLSRKEMEESARDVDIFINLYDQTRHKFGCSGSIFESFSCLKPVLHLSNDGYNSFNKIEKPIGYCCENLSELADKMLDMMENYSQYKQEFSVLRRNMLEYRKKYDIRNNLDKLRESFTFA